MKRITLGLVSLTGIVAAMAGQASATTVDINFNGPGVSGMLVVTYGAATDGKYANAYEVTSISGTFTDTNNGLNIVNATVGPLVPISPAAPDPTNLLAPDDFSKFSVPTGLPPPAPGAPNSTSLSYDNLYWPGGSSATASDYTFHGDPIDIYGLLFSIGNGRVVDIWSNGLDLPPFFPTGYGVAVAWVPPGSSAYAAADYVVGGVTVAPEPSTWALMGLGFMGLGFAGYRRARSVAVPA
jgi:PEP-CTERM motif